MDIKQIKNIEAVVAYNNQSALARLALSPTWSLGMGVGLLVDMTSKAIKNVFGKENNAVSKPMVLADIENKKLVNTTYASAYLTQYGLSVLFTKSAAVATFSSAVSTYLGVGFLTDMFGVGTGRSFGAMRSGYAQGRMGGNVTYDNFMAAKRAKAFNIF